MPERGGQVIGLVLMVNLLLQSESDLNLVLQTLTEGLEQDLGLLKVPPLANLEDAVNQGHPIAFFPAGIVLACAEVR